MRLTGPAILRSRPVAPFTEVLSNWVNFAGLIEDAAYQAPKPVRAKRIARMIRVIFKVLFIAQSFYI